MNFLNRLSFRSKLLLLTTINIIFIWIIAYLSINVVSERMLRKQFFDGAETISRTVSVNITEYLLTEDYNSLTLQVNNLLKNENIIYAVVTDPYGGIVFSNFYNEFPADLLELIKSLPKNKEKTVLITTEKGEAYHISQPIMDGKIGQLHIGFSLNNIKIALSKLNLYIFIAGLVMLFAGAGFSISYSLYLSRPFKKLLDAVNEIKRGNLDIRLEHSGNDEIAKLVSTFNIMVESIKNNIKMLENAWEKSVREEKISSIRELVRSIAEEINNPLTGVKHLAEIIKNSKNLDSVLLNDYVRLMNEGLERMNRVIQELIKYTGDISDSLKKLKVRDIIGNVWKIVSVEKSAPEVIINYTGEDNIIIYGNGSYLTYAFVNLFKNLVSQNFNNLIVNSSRKEKNIEIEITGMSGRKEKSPLYLPPNFPDLSFNISCRIIEMHGGSVKIESSEGAQKFIINLPAGEEHGQIAHN
jgi:signal transduction histidine kinase